MKRMLYGVLAMVSSLVACGWAAADGAADLEKLAGQPCRVTWTLAEGGRTGLSDAKTFSLWALDTQAKKGPVRLLEGTGYWVKPLLSPDGSKVIYTDLGGKQARIRMVSLEGGKPVDVVAGMAACVRRDAASGHDWLYYRAGREKGSAVWRCRLDKPEDRQLVYGHGPTDHDICTYLTVSGDGAQMAAAFPWPECGLASLPNGRWKKTTGGCWPSMAPDLSYRSWVFEGPHRGVHLFDRDGTNQRRVDFGQAPGVGKGEVYFPRWSNHAQFMIMTGPGVCGSDANVLVGKFDEGATRITAWANVTGKKGAYFYPDLWVQGAPAYKFAAAAEVAALDTQPDGKLSDQWPATTRGLLFLWQLSTAQNEVLTGENKRRVCRVDAQGSARPGWPGALSPSGGYFAATDFAGAVLEACRQSQQFTLEVTCTPANVTQVGPARMVTFSADAGRRNFTLGQEGDTLVFRLRTTQTGENGINPQTTLGKLQAGKPHHVIVTYTPGKLTWWLNGQRGQSTDVRGDLSNWEAMSLLLGDEVGGQRAWRGRLEGIAIYGRALSDPEAAAKWKQYSALLGARKAPARVEVEARLVSKVTIPDPAQMAQYPRCLVVYEYEVTKVLSGKLVEKRLAVTHWGILDRQVVAAVRDRAVGQVARLTLESFDQRPELASERRVESESPDVLSLWHDVTDE
jgi:hypothetical protein